MRSAAAQLALLALLPAAAQATCAIAVWTPDHLVLGVDSKETFLSPYHEPTTSTECKLRQIGPYYVLVSGVMQHRRSGFDVWKIIGQSISRTDSVTEAAADAAVEISRRWDDVLRVARNGPNREYRRELESNAPVFAVAGFSKGRPYLAYYEYDLVRGAWTWRKEIYGPRTGDTMGYAYLCDLRGINAYKRAHPQWRREDPLKTVPGMIAATARLDSSEVGGPTALLVVDATGSYWESAGTCR